MILHLLSDDKFTDYAIKQFSRLAPVQNEFVILSWRDDAFLEYVKNKDQVIVIREDSEAVTSLCQNIQKYTAVITHNLSTRSKERTIEEAAHQKIKTAWVFWGFEFYGIKKLQRHYLGKKTSPVYMKHQLKRNLKNLKARFFNGVVDKGHYEVPAEVFQKIDYCLTDLKEDYVVAKSHFHSDFDLLWYNYYSIEETLGSLHDKRVNDNNILVGNSASFSNNHLDVFDKLEKFDLQGRQIIAPLSYGNTWYARQIAKKGARIFGGKFQPLMTFMDISDYNRILRSCSIVIMNQYRHQGMGNIITALWLGAKVYLSLRSTTYKYFKRLGAHVFSVEEGLTPKNQKVLASLPDDLVLENRNILMKEYGREIMDKRIRHLIKTLLEKGPACQDF